MIIKIEELRIGNWVMGYHDPFQWSLDHFDLLKQADLDEIIKEPVLITEEVLLKSGFVNNKPKDWGSFTLGNINFLKEDGNKMNGLYMNGYRVADIRYLHQLQNAYYAITGEELDIKL